MLIGDIVSLVKKNTFSPNKLGATGIILNNSQIGGNCKDVYWFSDLQELSNVGRYYYGSDRVSVIGEDEIKFVEHKDEKYRIGDNVIILCPSKEYLPHEITSDTVFKFNGMKASGCSCSILYNNEEYQVSFQYMMKESQYLKYTQKYSIQTNPNENDLLDKIYDILN